MPLLKLKKPQKTPGNIVFIFASLENLRLVNRQGRWRVGLNKTLVLKLHFCTSFKFFFFGCENLFFQILWKIIYYVLNYWDFYLKNWSADFFHFFLRNFNLLCAAGGTEVGGRCWPCCTVAAVNIFRLSIFSAAPGFVMMFTAGSGATSGGNGGIGYGSIIWKMIGNRYI